MIFFTAATLLLIVYLGFHTKFMKKVKYTIHGNVANDIRLVHISDLHGSTTFINGLLRTHINRCKPDIVCITGDLANHHKQLPKVMRELGKIRCDHIYFIPGNHEREETIGLKKRKMKVDYRDFMSDNITILENVYAAPTIKDTSILIYGFDNSVYGNERFDSSADQVDSDYRVFLAHSPNIVRLINRNKINYDLLLCGHTHGGQIRLFNRTIGSYKHFHVGMKEVSKHSYFGITSGLGVARIPIRHACFPEIAVYNIKKA